jgi:hypothetical protein
LGVKGLLNLPPSKGGNEGGKIVNSKIGGGKII